MHPFRFRWLLLATTLVLLAACGNKGDEQDATAHTTPAKSVLATARLLKNGQFDALLQHVLPPDAYRQARAAWQHNHSGMQEASVSDRQHFAQAMQRITAPDAEHKLWAQLQPKLEQFNKQYKNQLPVTAGFMQMMLGSQIDKSDTLTADQKSQAKNVVQTLGDWIRTTDWGNPDKARHAIDVVTSTARKLDIHTLDQANALNYDQAMQKYAVLWGGLKQLLDTYGLSVEKTLDSVTAKTLQSNSHAATVQLHYTLLGKPQTLDVQMINMDGRWYDKALVDHWHKHQAEQAARAASTAAAASAAPAATARPASAATVRSAK